MTGHAPVTGRVSASGAPRVLVLGALGCVFVVLGVPLVGSTWIDPAGIIAGGVALLATALSTRTSLDALVVLTPFMFRILSPVGILNLGTSDVLVPVILVLLVVRAVVERDPRRAPGPVAAGAVPLVVGTAVLVTGSLAVWALVDPDFLVTKAVSDTMKLVVGIVYFGLVIGLTRAAGEAGALRAVALWSWVATGLAAASLVGAVTGLGLVPSDGYRSLGYFADPNLYAGYLLLSLAVLVFRATVDRTPWLPVQAVVIVAGVVTTGSRGGLLTLALLVLFSALILNSARLRIAVVTLTVLVTAGGYVVLRSEDGGSNLLGVDRLLVSSAESGDDARFELWRRAVSLWLDHPVFGIGMGQYPRFSVGIVGEDSSSELGHVVHNSFLSVLVSLGLVGLVLFLLMFAWILRTLYRSDALLRISRHALAGGVLVIVAQMITLNLENLRYVWVYFGLVVGLSLPLRVVPGPDVGPVRTSGSTIGSGHAS